MVVFVSMGLSLILLRTQDSGSNIKQLTSSSSLCTYHASAHEFYFGSNPNTYDITIFEKLIQQMTLASWEGGTVQNGHDHMLKKCYFQNLVCSLMKATCCDGQSRLYPNILGEKFK